ncbi:MAG: tRNA (guanosine(46)-N7)-methyltransferase TrmB [Dermatophilus congolensis]|nr:tRNA (guanosine(46)-N7)-methyltransferase TrmB [Dermatophilus congolensis]
MSAADPESGQAGVPGQLGESHGRGPLVRREVVSFTRRDGRFSHRNSAAWEPRLAHYFVEPERAERSTSIAPTWHFDAESTFGRRAPLIVEIGSGTGDAVLAHAQAHPECDHLAVEVYRPGVARTVVQADARGLENVRVLEADGRALLAHTLTAESVAELHIWFPDPWPKARHHKRRLIDSGLLTDAARVLTPGGVLRAATDWADYADQIAAVAADAEAFEPGGPAPTDAPVGVSGAQRYGAAPRFEVRPITRFESKGRALGRDIADFALRRR